MKTLSGLVLVLVLALALVAAACRTTRSSRPLLAGAQPTVVRFEAVRAFRVVDGGAELGFVVEFRDATGSGEGFYSVRNGWQQELGLIDDLGRAWRYHPHEREPEWIGTGTVAEGARLVLAGGPGTVLEPLAAVALAGAQSGPAPARARRE